MAVVGKRHNLITTVGEKRARDDNEGVHRYPCHLVECLVDLLGAANLENFYFLADHPRSFFHLSSCIAGSTGIAGIYKNSNCICMRYQFGYAAKTLWSYI